MTSCDSKIIASIEVCAVLRKAISGHLMVKLVTPSFTWDRAYAGVVTFWFDTWQISFFNDCDELDIAKPQFRSMAEPKHSWLGINVRGANKPASDL